MGFQFRIDIYEFDVKYIVNLYVGYYEKFDINFYLKYQVVIIIIVRITKD